MTFSATADEGMWTFDNPPNKLLQERYSFTPTQEWLDHVRLSCVRLQDGGSGSFVSPNGLLLTNHHVASGQLQKNSTAEHDYLKDGFYAPTADKELPSPDLEVNVLVSMENVTARVQAALKGAANGSEALAARKKVTADIERESLQATGLRSDVISLYQGGEYWLYRYKKYTDVRLVFAPEQQIAFYGGDPDNFTFPRFDLDMALFRVYENGKPLETKNYLKWNSKGAVEDELVFVSGHPGGTQRLDTVAELTTERDLIAPSRLKIYSSRLATMRAYSALGTEQARQAKSLVFSFANSQKAFIGRLQGLRDPAIFDKKKREESEFRALVDARPEWKAKYAGAWTNIEKAETEVVPKLYRRQLFRGLDSSLWQLTINVVRYVAEVKKADGVRLAGFHESQLESMRLRLYSPAPIYPALETARFAGSLKLGAGELGADDPYIATILGGKSADEVAKGLMTGTKMGDAKFRKALIEGGEAAIAASDDPLIIAARKVDPLGREMIKALEEQVVSVLSQAGEKIGEARFLAYGKSTYPDANFTLRLSYGAVKGYPMNGTVAPAKTTFYGLYDRAASFNYSGDWYLPSRWMEGRDKLNLATPFDFVTTNDIIGGNSGSPVINRNAELVGLVFDGNIESLPGDYEYEGEKNRSVAVHTGAMAEALRKLYGAGKLADELQAR